MKNIEEQLWDYIDGLTTENERKALEEKIGNDPTYALMYAELMEIQQMMYAAELEEPSMSFTRKVMEKVNQEMTPVTLKAKVDTRIIYGLAAVFLLGILFVFAYAISNYTLSGLPMLSFKRSLNIDQLVNPLSIRIFLFVDVVLALIYVDGFLRRKKA